MTDLLLALGKMNLAAAAAILAVILIRKPSRHVFGARQAYRLWLLVPLAALAALIPASTKLVTLAPQAVPTLPSGLPDQADGFAAQAPSLVATSTPGFTIDPMALLAVVWLAGMVATAAWFARKQSRFHADERNGLAGPAVVGVVRPRIVTPANFGRLFSERERTVILAHETIHIARQDVRTNGLVALIRCVCWFNPLIHIAAHLMRIDQELACDAQVIERHPNIRRTYAEALLKAELGGTPPPLGCYWPPDAQHPLTERVAMLKRNAPTRARRFVGVGGLIVLAAGAGVAAWAAQPQRVVYVEELQPVTAPAPEPAIEQPRDASPMRATPVMEQPQPATPVAALNTKQALPTQAPFPGWITPASNDNWVPVAISGTITSVKWVNPSTQIFVHGNDGKDWYILSSTPNALLRMGGTPATMSSDAHIAVTGQQDLSIACAPLCVAMARAEDLTIAGRKLQPVSGKAEVIAARPEPALFEAPQPQPSAPQPMAAMSAPLVDASGMKVFVPVYMMGSDKIDPNSPVTVAGTVTGVKWVNPSTQITVRGAGGSDWVIQSGTPNSMLRTGFTKNNLRVGAAITAQGHRERPPCAADCAVFVAPDSIALDSQSPAPVKFAPPAAPPAPPPLPPMPKPQPWGPKPASLKQAIDSGNAWFVPDLGGSAQDMLNALRIKAANDPFFTASGRQTGQDRVAAMLAELADTSNGAKLTYLGDGGNGRAIRREEPTGVSAMISLKEDGGFGVSRFLSPSSGTGAPKDGQDARASGSTSAAPAPKP